jgi:hypothetical protein
MRPRPLAPALLATALLFACPAAAQDKPATAPPAAEDNGEIVVTGREVRDDQVRDFVSGLTGNIGSDPLPRFVDAELCPVSLGLTPAFDAAITTRMRRVAMAANIRVAREGCRANALVIFAPDKDATIRALRKGYPQLFYQPTGAPVRLRDKKEPVTSWVISDFVDSEGVAVPIDTETGQYVLESSGSVSRLTTPMRPIYRMSVLVIEIAAVEGLTITQIADYAAMRAFTGANPDRVRNAGVPTILTIVEAPIGSEIPNSMTAWDLGFLRGLYAAPPNLRAPAQRGRIARDLKQGTNAGSETGDRPAP